MPLRPEYRAIVANLAASPSRSQFWPLHSATTEREHYNGTDRFERAFGGGEKGDAQGGIPQVVGKTEKTRKGMEGLEGNFTRPRQVMTAHNWHTKVVGHVGIPLVLGRNSTD
jgi:hypothetical protein